MVDLAAFARERGRDDDAVALVGEWLGRLQAEPGGAVIARNLATDDRLEVESEALVGRLVDAVLTQTDEWRRPNGAVAWLHNMLRDRSVEFLCQGAPVPSDAETRALSRLASYAAVWFVTRTELRESRPVTYEGWRRWGRTIIEVDGVLDRINPDARVMGRLPIVWATPTSDRHARWPPGTPIEVALARCGKAMDADSPYAVMQFGQTEPDLAGPVPTGLDAHDHAAFWAAAPGAAWGRTRDLSTGDVEVTGVRECVLPAFPARHLSGIDPA